MADPQRLCQRFPYLDATRQITHDRWPFNPFEVKNNICGTWQAQRGALEGVDIDGLHPAGPEVRRGTGSPLPIRVRVSHFNKLFFLPRRSAALPERKGLLIERDVIHP